MDQFGQSQKIVIVEDNTSLAEIYKTRLELLGYVIKVAADGVTALNLIKEEKPDLVLLDLMVPKIAGDQILETMRKSDWGRDIPVFIISNLNESDAPAGLRGMGIEGYAVKANLSNDQLDELVDKILKPASQKENESLESTSAPVLSSHPVELPNSEPVTSSETPEPPVEVPTIEVVDTAESESPKEEDSPQVLSSHPAELPNSEPTASAESPLSAVETTDSETNAPSEETSSPTVEAHDSTLTTLTETTTHSEEVPNIELAPTPETTEPQEESSAEESSPEDAAAPAIAPVPETAEIASDQT